MLPDDLRSFRANIPLMRRVAVALSAMVSTLLFAVGSYQLPYSRLRDLPLSTVDVATIAINVMNSNGREAPVAVWTDPHTNMERAAFCEVHDLGIMMLAAAPSPTGNDREQGGAK